MITSENSIARVLAQGREFISNEWMEAVTRQSRGRISAIESERQLAPIFSALAEALQSGSLDPQTAAFDELRVMLAEFSRNRARQGFSPSETVIAVYALRDVVLAAMDQAKASFQEVRAFTAFMDKLGLITFETFAAARESVIAQQTNELLELSTPVVKLWEGIVAVPLVGTLDSSRTQVVMEALLEALISTGSEHAIIDITGVPAVDTQVAQHLLKTIVAARLMGADCVISGIRPQIAQTIVGLGIEFGDIITKATLADALRLTFQRAGLEVRKSGRPA